MPTDMTYERMKNNRKRLFHEKKIDHRFEPYIGKTYYCEKQKHILFVSYDEWAYRIDDSTSKPKPNTYADFDVSHLFRSSEYYKYINKVLKGIKSYLTMDDIAFYNFLVHPIDWTDYYKIHNRNYNADYITKSTEMFEHVIDFCNPDIIIFCSKDDHDKINIALNNQLNSFLRERGIEYLESGNLNYDLDENPETDDPIHKEPSDIRTQNGNLFFDQAIVDDLRIEQTCNYDYIRLDLQQVALNQEQKYNNIPDELQKLAAFIDCETRSPGSFMRHQTLQFLNDIERKLQKCYVGLMEEDIEDVQNTYDYQHNHLCSKTMPALYETLHMLKALTNEYEKATIEQTIPKINSCCTYSSKDKRASLLSNHANDLSEKKKKILDEIKFGKNTQDTDKKGISKGSANTDKKREERIDKEAPDTDKQEKTAQRWKNLSYFNRNLNERMRLNRATRKRFDSLLDEYINCSQLTENEYHFLKENCQKYTGSSLDELDKTFDNMDNSSETFEKEFMDPFLQIIKDLIKKNPNITLESLSKAVLVDEYYLGSLLQTKGIQQKNGRWHGLRLKKN